MAVSKVLLLNISLTSNYSPIYIATTEILPHNPASSGKPTDLVIESEKRHERVKTVTIYANL